MKAPDAWRPLSEALLGKAELTVSEVAAGAGVAPDHARRLWRALGFPPVPDDDRVFTHSDLEILRAVRLLVERQETNPADVIQLTRVIGQSLARLADAQVTTVATRLTRVQDPGSSDPLAIDDLVQRIQTLAPALEQFLGYVWRRHLLAAVLRLAATPAPADHPLTVGFADLVGFTAISQALDAQALADMVDRFEVVAYEQIVEHGGRLVKMIGDEVMFSADDPAVAAEIALALVDAHARESALPNVRVGLARGPTLSWEGDLFGPTVNLASRLVNLARPSTVLISEDLAQLLQEHPRFTLRHTRPVNLRGIGRVPLWVLRHSA